MHSSAISKVLFNPIIPGGGVYSTPPPLPLKKSPKICFVPEGCRDFWLCENGLLWKDHKVLFNPFIPKWGEGVIQPPPP